jgi:ABC-type transport system involved in multi-copper enzyme maturation permease subunit
MLRVVWRVAVSVFRESVRDKVLYNLVFFAVLLMAASLLLGQLSAGQEVKIIKDLGLAAMSVFGLFIAVFIGIGLVFKEVERRSVYGLLAKPITRAQFVLGKYAGLVLTLAANLAIMVVAFYAVLAWLDATTPEPLKRAWEAPALDPAMLKAVILVLLQLMVVTAIALLFSTFSSPLLSAAFTFGLFVAGHFAADLRNFEQVVQSPAAGWVTRGLYYVLPNMAVFDVKAQVVHGEPVPWSDLGLAAAYAALYIGALLSGAVWIFSRRDFK